MLVIVGAVVVMLAVVGGYLFEGGNLLLLVQPAEFIIIGGAAIGSMVMATSPSVLKGTAGQIGSLLGSGLTKDDFADLLVMLYKLFRQIQQGGVMSVESHLEKPSESAIFGKHPKFLSRHHSLDFLADSMKVIIVGGINAHDLEALMEEDLKVHHDIEAKPAAMLAKIGDALPGLGIVAAVLGVVITMGSIGGKPEEIGHHVASALVGTFLGVLLAYGIFAPLAAAAENQLGAEAQYMACIRAALLSFARGDAPLTAVEFARRNIEPASRCSFSEMEQTLKGGAKQAA